MCAANWPRKSWSRRRATSPTSFTNGGADAIEHAIRMARLTTGKSKILDGLPQLPRRYRLRDHGHCEARRHGNPTTDGDVKHFWGPFLYRSAFYSSTQEEECARALQSLEETLVYEDNVAAVLIESVVGSSGIIVPAGGLPAGRARDLDRHGALYIADEVMAGFGRTGKMFAYEHGGKDLQPDLVTFAKGEPGMAPLGGVMMNEAVYQRFADKPYPGGLTYSGHPLACAPGLAAQKVYREENTREGCRAGRARDRPGDGEDRGEPPKRG